MDHRFDLVAKAMATATTRREALKWLSGMVGGVLMGSTPLGYAARPGGAGGQGSDACRSFCDRNTVSGPDRRNCLNECTKCGGNISQICGQRGSFVCCVSPNYYCPNPGAPACYEYRRVDCDCALAADAEPICFPTRCVATFGCGGAAGQQQVCAQLCASECGPATVVKLTSCVIADCS